MNEVDLGVRALMAIAVASLATTLIALLVMRRWSDQVSIARWKSQAQAHLLELRLFSDDPAQILRSQRELVIDNFRLMRLLLRPLLILALPTALAIWGLDALFRRAPLRVDEAAVVSADSRHSSIATPDGVVVETKPVFVQAMDQTSWRIRPLRAMSGTLRIGSMEERIVAGTGFAYLPDRFIAGNNIYIGYPRATVLGLHWLLWFVLFSLIAAFVLRRPMRVVF